MAANETLGSRLRQLRNKKDLGLREAATRAGITHGYLSQIESDKVKEPAPQVLQKLAEAYDEPFILLMQWAGYLEEDPEGLSANQARALKIVGDPTDNELKAIRAVLDAIRSGGASFPVFAAARRASRRRRSCPDPRPRGCAAPEGRRSRRDPDAARSGHECLKSRARR